MIFCDYFATVGSAWNVFLLEAFDWSVFSQRGALFHMKIDTTKSVPIGLCAIIDELGLRVPYPTVRSELKGGTRKTTIADNQVLEQYPAVYRPDPGMAGHLRFALRHEPVDLRVYKAAFQRMGKRDLERWVQSEPHGIFARRAWYLYELLTGETLDVADLTSGPYVDLLDQDLHIAGPPIRVKAPMRALKVFPQAE